MQYKYFPHTEEDIRQMLDKIGVQSLDDLYEDVPEDIKLKGGYVLPSAYSETELRNLFEEMKMFNSPLTVFAGAGCYDILTCCKGADSADCSRAEHEQK